MKLPLVKSAFPIVIEPKTGWQLVDWRELVEYRDLFGFLVWRDVKALYKQSVLGFGWAILQPLVTMALFTLVFDQLAGLSTDGVPGPLFYFAALAPWTYFQNALSGAATSLITQANLLSKVYVPRLVIPMTPVLAKLVDFAIALAVLIAMITGYHLFSPTFAFRPSWALLALPLLVLMTALAAAGLGLWLSAMAVQYRDIKFAMGFLTQFLMYAAPVVWPASLLPEALRPVVGLYPMFGIIDGFRAILVGKGGMPWDLVASGFLGTLILFASGVLVFKRLEQRFADVA